MFNCFLFSPPAGSGAWISRRGFTRRLPCYVSVWTEWANVAKPAEYSDYNSGNFNSGNNNNNYNTNSNYNRYNVYNSNTNAGYSSVGGEIKPLDRATSESRRRKQKIRFRSILLPPQNGGAACPHLKETKAVDPPKNDWIPNEGFPRSNEEMREATGFHKRDPISELADRFARYFLSPVALKNPFGIQGESTLVPRDIVFLVDMSGSITLKDFAKAMDALADLIGEICGGVNGQMNSNRVSVVTFDQRVVLNFDFDDHLSLADVQKAVRRVTPMRGATCTGNAIKYVYEFILGNLTSGIRPYGRSDKDVLILTDGLSNCGVEVDKWAPLLKLRANVFSLLIGSYTQAGILQIESMVSDPVPTHLFSLQNYNQFEELVTRIKSSKNPFPCVPLVMESLNTR